MEQFEVDNYSNNHTLTFKKRDESSQFSFNVMNVDSNKQSCQSNNRKSVVYSNTKKETCYDSMMDECNVICTSSTSEHKTNSDLLVDNLFKRDSQDEKSYILHRWLHEQVAYSTEGHISTVSDKIPSLKVNRSPTSLEYQILNSVDSKHSILSKDIIEKETKFSNIISRSVGSLSSSSFTLSMSHINSISKKNNQSNKYYTTKSQDGLGSSKEKHEKLFNSSPCGSSTHTLHNEQSKNNENLQIFYQNHLSNHYVIDDKMDQQSNQRRLSSIPKNQSLDKTTEMLTSTRRSNYLHISKNRFLDKTVEMLTSTRRSNYLTYSNADPFTINNNNNNNDLAKVFELDPYDDIIKSYYNTTDRRIKSISIKTNCIIQINGPFTTFYKHAKSSIVNLSKIKYQCHIYGFNEKMLEKCINFMKETFPNSLLHFYEKKG
ncbi:unnamed protein product [Schistosoma rodhaini]|nr:unnamed protein product [Schistosoma rodhaini]